jgi:hypothetical protein
MKALLTQVIDFREAIMEFSFRARLARNAGHVQPITWLLGHIDASG